LARALKDEGAQVTIVSWTQQYPAIIPREFVDKASRSDFLEGYDIPVKYLTNWNDPRTWGATAKAIAALKPDKVIIQWYNPTQGIPLNSIAKYLRKHTKQRSSSTCTSWPPKNRAAWTHGSRGWHCGMGTASSFTRTRQRRN
jgi:hypothetical protein